MVILLTSLSLQSMENNDYSLIQLPRELFAHCLSPEENQVISLVNSIKNFVTLRTTCTYFNTLLTPEIISDFCKNYAPVIKEIVWRNERYRLPHRPMWPILLCTDVKKADKFLEIAVKTNYSKLVELAFKYNANPDAVDKHDKIPLIFFVKTVEIAKMFIDRNVNLHVTKKGKDIISCTMEETYPVELFALYLSYPVFNINYDIVPLVYPDPVQINDLINFLQKVELLKKTKDNLWDDILFEDEDYFEEHEFLGEPNAITMQQLIEQNRLKNKLKHKKQNCIIS